jgi:hypothetical protein
MKFYGIYNDRVFTKKNLQCSKFLILNKKSVRHRQNGRKRRTSQTQRRINGKKRRKLFEYFSIDIEDSKCGNSFSEYCVQFTVYTLVIPLL